MSSSSNMDAKCPVCLQLFSDPRVLDCGHTLCLSCVVPLAKKSAKSGCPVCRQKAVPKSAQVPSLPKNYALAALIEGAEKRTPCPSCNSEIPESRLIRCVRDDVLCCTACFLDSHYWHESREHRPQQRLHFYMLHSLDQANTIPGTMTIHEHLLPMCPETKDLQESGALISRLNCELASLVQHATRKLDSAGDILFKLLQKVPNTRVYRRPMGAPYLISGPDLTRVEESISVCGPTAFRLAPLCQDELRPDEERAQTMRQADVMCQGCTKCDKSVELTLAQVRETMGHFSTVINHIDGGCPTNHGPWHKRTYPKLFGLVAPLAVPETVKEDGQADDSIMDSDDASITDWEEDAPRMRLVGSDSD